MAVDCLMFFCRWTVVHLPRIARSCLGSISVMFSSLFVQCVIARRKQAFGPKCIAAVDSFVLSLFFLWWIDNHEQGSVVAIGGMADAGDGNFVAILLLLPTRHFRSACSRG